MDDAARNASPGLEPGGGVAPGDTPPGEGSTLASLSDRPPPGRSSDVDQSRAPMWIALIAISLVVLAFLVYFVAAVVGYNRDDGLDEQGLHPPAVVRAPR